MRKKPLFVSLEETEKNYLNKVYHNVCEYCDGWKTIVYQYPAGVDSKGKTIYDKNEQPCIHCKEK
jgi:hypothetical protein